MENVTSVRFDIEKRVGESRPSSAKHGEVKKTCRKCKSDKELSAFYIHKTGKHGRSGICKICVKERYNERIEKEDGFVAKVRLNTRKRYRRLGKEIYQKDLDTKPWMIAAQKARARLRYRLRNEIPKGHQLHHWSYKDEHLEDVIVLMRVLHKRIHLHMVLDIELRLFRTPDGELLDTKEKHLNHIKPFLSEPIPASLQIN